MGYGSAGIIAADYKTPRRWYNYSGASDGSATEVLASGTFASSQDIVMFTENVGAAIVSNSGTVSIYYFSTQGTTVTVGAGATVASTTYLQVGACALSANVAVVCYRDNASPYYIHAVVCSYSGGTWTIGTSVELLGGAQGFLQDIQQLDSTHFIAGMFNSGSQYLSVQVGSISGTTITLGTTVQDTSRTTARIGLATLSSSSIFCFDTYGTAGKVRTISVSGTTATLNTASTFTNTSDCVFPYPAAANSTNVAMAFGSSTTPGTWYAQAYTISGTTVTAGSQVQISSSTPQWGGTTVYLGSDSDNYNYYGAIARDYPSTGDLNVKIFRVINNGTTVDTSGPEVTVYSGTAGEPSQATVMNFTDDGYAIIGISDTNAYLKVLTMFNS